MAKRIIALLLALTLVFAFAACKKSDKEDETTAPETEIVTNADGEEVVVPAEDETEAEEVTNAEGEVVTDAEEATEAETDAAGKPAATDAAKPEANKPAGNKIPSTKAEIVAAYNAAANAVKADKPGYSKTEKNIIDEIKTSSKLLNKMIPGIVKAFPTAGPSATVAKGASHKDFPVQNGTTNLSPAAVKSATATPSGSGYTILIKMNDEKLAALPTNPNATQHGKAFNVLSKAVVDEQVAGIPGVKITKFQPTYTGSYIKATINANGKMTSAEYLFYTKAILHVNAVGIDLDVLVPFGVQQNYTIKY